MRSTRYMLTPTAYGLLEEGLVSQAEIDAAVYSGSPHQVDYAWAARAKTALLHAAFQRSAQKVKELEAFCKEQAFWLQALHGRAGEKRRPALA